MNVDLIFQVAFVGILVAVINQVLSRAGRDDQAMMTSLVGIIVVLYWVVTYINELFMTITELFGL